MKLQKEERLQIAVVGGGSWATAIVKMLSEGDYLVNWWIKDPEDLAHIQKYRHNPSYLSMVEIHPEKVRATGDLPAALAPSSVVILVVPSAFVADALQPLSPEHFREKVVVSAIKGMTPESNSLVTQYMHHTFEVPYTEMGVIAGPCHAEEVGMEKQSYLTLASDKAELAEELAQMFRCRFIRANPLGDVIGIEYCAVMKNIIAIACGIAHGLNYGDNFQAVLVSNAMQEIGRFLNAVSPKERDLNGSSYLGDLLVTTYSQFSRNRTFGNMIGRGYSVKSAQMEMNMVAEGYYAVRSIHYINQQFAVDMPIASAVYNVLYERISPIVEFRILKDKLS